MPQDNRHRSFLNFIRKIIDIAAGYSKEDLMAFHRAACRDHSSLAPLIEEYVRLAERSDTDVQAQLWAAGRGVARRRAPAQAEMHLFDLLREKRLFPSNADLSDFAGRVLPSMDRKRFDKMSRGDMAARIIEYIERRDPRTRKQLEASMRDALASAPSRNADRQSFLSKWERIIKGTDI